MVRSDAAAKVIHDPSHSYAHRYNSGASASEWRNFMSPNLTDMYRKPMSRVSNQHDIEDEEIDIRKMLKDIEYLGSSNMTWKERKELQNRNVVTLGGKPPKKHRTPLSVAKPAMKNQQKREEKKLEERAILGRFEKHGNNNRAQKQHKPENRVLKASEGHFSKGVLNVKHLLHPAPSKGDDSALNMFSKGTKKGKGKKGKKGQKGKKGKKKGR